MPSSERIYRNSIRTFSLIFIALGLLILGSTIANGGGPLSLGVLMGVAFLAVGVARLWLSGAFRGWRGGRGGRGRTVARPQRPPFPRDRTRGRGHR